MCYTSLHPNDMSLGTKDEVFALCVESLKTWRVCMAYGLACDHFRYVWLWRSCYIKLTLIAPILRNLEPKMNSCCYKTYKDIL